MPKTRVLKLSFRARVLAGCEKHGMIAEWVPGEGLLGENAIIRVRRPGTVTRTYWLFEITEASALNAHGTTMTTYDVVYTLRRLLEQRT